MSPGYAIIISTYCVTQMSEPSRGVSTIGNRKVVIMTHECYCMCLLAYRELSLPSRPVPDVEEEI